MKTCYGYVRVSTVKQGDGVSLDAQKEAIELYAHRNIIKITKWFEEKVTAAKRGRPLFDQMVASLKRGDADGVVFHKIDRSARNFADWARIGDLAEAGIEICFATETLDFNSRGGRLTADIQAVIAADYIRNLREESIKGQIGRLKMGLFPYAAPIGYLDTGKGKAKAMDPERAPLVRELFSLYATGDYSYDRLHCVMAEKGLTTKSGRPLTRTGIEHTLNNPFYYGLIKIRRTGKTYPGAHTPIISHALFKAAESVRVGRRQRKTLTRHGYLFRGLFMCEICSKTMVGERQRGHVYYRCHTRACPTKTVREEAISAALDQHLKSIEFSPQEVDALRGKFEGWLRKFDQAAMKHRTKARLAKLENRLSSLTDKFVDELIDQSIYESKRDDISKSIAECRSLLAQEDKTDWYRQKLEELLEHAKSLVFAYQIADRTRKREIILFASSNRVISRKQIAFARPDWRRMPTPGEDVHQCAHYRDTTRTFEAIKQCLLQELV